MHVKRPLWVAIALVLATAACCEDGAPGESGEDGQDGEDGLSAVSCAVSPGESIQDCVDSVIDDGGGSVLLSAGVHVISETVHIWGDGVQLQGEGPGTVLSVADDAQVSAITIGSLDETPSVTVSDVTVRDLSIDGNRDDQSSEFWAAPHDHIAVSGLTLRGAERIRLQDLDVWSARSAGVLTEKGTRDVLVSGLDVRDSYFDGLSCNDSSSLQVFASRFTENDSAGITADCDCRDSLFDGLLILDNGQGPAGLYPGVYLSTVNGLTFTHNDISGHPGDGILLTMADCGAQGARDNLFLGNVIEENEGHPVSIGHETVAGNVGTGNCWRDNGGEGIWPGDVSEDQYVEHDRLCE